MSSRIIPAKKIVEIIIISVQFIGIRISGSFLFRVFAFAFLAINRIRIPVRLADTVPPIPRIRAKLTNPSSSAMRYIPNGTSEVNRKFFVLDVFTSYLKVSRRE